MTYEEALQIAKEELDEKIEYLSDTFKGHSARVESYIYDLSMARKALMQALQGDEKKFAFKREPINFMPLEETPENFERSHQKEREWVGLTDNERMGIAFDYRNFNDARGDWFDRTGFARAIEAKLKEKNT